MKKSSLIAVSVTSLVVLVGLGLWLYSSSHNATVADNKAQSSIEKNSQKDTRELIWDKLPVSQRERVDGTWKSGTLTVVTLDKNSVGWIDDKSYEGKEVYLVDYPTKNTGVPNNMLIYADKDTFEYIGNAPVD